MRLPYLVCAIEENRVLLGFHELAKLCPLVLRRVDSRRVVCTGVQQEHRLVLRRLHVREQTYETYLLSDQRGKTDQILAMDALRVD